MNADELKVFLLSTIGKESSKEITYEEAEKVIEELLKYTVTKEEVEEIEEEQCVLYQEGQ